MKIFTIIFILQKKSEVPKNDFKTQETTPLKRDRISDRDKLLKTQVNCWIISNK